MYVQCMYVQCIYVQCMYVQCMYVQCSYIKQLVNNFGISHYDGIVLLMPPSFIGGNTHSNI